MKNKVIIIIMILIITVLIFVGCVDNNTNTDSWLDGYIPAHSIGTGDDDFWIYYPQMNPSSGQEVDHFDWMIDSLKSRPVLFVVHRTGCVGCADQAERVIEFGEEYNDCVKLYDLDAVEGASYDIQQKANQVYMYDPNGSPGYIALTGLFTYVKDNDEVKIAWHTWEAPNDMTVSNFDLDTWIKDAIYYYNINSG